MLLQRCHRTGQPGHRSVRAPSIGFRPQSRHRSQQVRHGRSQTPAVRAPPSGFLTLSASASCQDPLRPCFMPQPRPGFSLQGVSLASSHSHLSAAVYPPVVGQGLPASPKAGASAPRLDFRVFNPPVESVSSGTDVTPHQAPIPSWDFIPPRVFLPPALETATRLLLP